MPKFTTTLSGVTILQAGYDTYTDTAGTTLANTNGALVAALKAGSINATQSNSVKRPTLVTAGTPWGLDYISFDGSDDVIEDTALAIGPDLTILMVMRHKKRATPLGSQAIIASCSTADPSIYSSASQMAFGQITPGISSNADMSWPNQWALCGICFGTDRLFVADNREQTVTVGSKITATTKLSFGGYTWAGGYNSAIDVVMCIIAPTTALTSGNLTTLRSELAAYLGSLPLAVPSGRTLAVVEGNSLLGAGCYADFTSNEYTALAAGTRWEFRNIGVSSSTSTGGNNSINARRAYRDAYPASVGRTRANSILLMGEGANAPTDTTGFIAEVNYAAAQGWHRVVVMLPPVTSGWAQGDANVTTFYTTVKNTTFPANVVFCDSRLAPLATYSGTYFADTVHLSTAGHAALAGLLTTTLDSIPGFDTDGDEENMTLTAATTTQALTSAEYTKIGNAGDSLEVASVGGQIFLRTVAAAGSAPTATLVGVPLGANDATTRSYTLSGVDLWARAEGSPAVAVIQK